MRAVIESPGKKKNGNGKQRPPSAAPPIKKKKRSAPAPTAPVVPGSGLGTER